MNGLVGFMRGRTNDVVKRLTADMEKASEELEFEKAARLRDDLGAIDKLMEQQTVVLGMVRQQTLSLSQMMNWKLQCRFSMCAMDVSVVSAAG